jgi:AcrR family transcriptional regulator
VTGELGGRRRPAAVAPGRGPAAAHAAARAAYLRGDSLDMSALAAELGVGRATLYRWVGNREDLLGAVLAEATERTFRAAIREVDRRGRPAAACGGPGSPAGAPPAGAERVLAIIECAMQRVLAAGPLRALTQREPRVFVRLATSFGPIQDCSTRIVRELIETEVGAGRMRTALPAGMLAQALVRMADGPLYGHLVGGGEPRLDEALAVAAVLLGLETQGAN